MLALAGGKGGCGKTTTACGLARALVRAGHRPLVVDADVDMPDLHERVGAAPGPGLDAIAAGANVYSVVQTDHDLEGAGVIASGGADSPAVALQRLASLDGPLLVDCPAGAGPDVAEAIQVADRSVVVSTDTQASLEDAAKTAAMSRALGTPVACLLLRRTRGRTEARFDDERLRRLVEAPAIVRLPAGPDLAVEPTAKEAPRGVSMAGEGTRSFPRAGEADRSSPRADEAHRSFSRADEVHRSFSRADEVHRSLSTPTSRAFDALASVVYPSSCPRKSVPGHRGDGGTAQRPDQPAEPASRRAGNQPSVNGSDGIFN